jgi:hypothetical protein
LQAAIGISSLEVFERKASLSYDLLLEVNPTETKAASAIVEYPALARFS